MDATSQGTLSSGRPGSEPAPEPRPQAPTAYVRSFNRYEYKYVIDHRQCVDFCRDLEPFTRPDPHCTDELGYGVRSLYWDSPERTFFWEKIEGFKDRRKLRFRRYPASDQVFIEIKQRTDRTIQKRRTRWPLDRTLAVFGPHTSEKSEDSELTDEERNDPVVREALVLCRMHNLQPAAWITYRRRALFAIHESDLRITVDRRLRYETQDLDLERPPEEGKCLLDPNRAVLEIKFNDRVPRWLCRLLEEHGIELSRMSKYCTAIDREFFDGRLT